MLQRLKQWARGVKRDVVAVYFAARDPRTPMPAKLLAMAVAAYALSPIDLIPDFIPVLGYLDDLIIVPLGLMLVIRMLPADVLATARERAKQVMERPSSRVAAALVVVAWCVAVAAGIYWWLNGQ
ncbi:MAG: YkvA family protein [Rubrivivax sp.]